MQKCRFGVKDGVLATGGDAHEIKHPAKMVLQRRTELAATYPTLPSTYPVPCRLSSILANLPPPHSLVTLLTPPPPFPSAIPFLSAVGRPSCLRWGSRLCGNCESGPSDSSTVSVATLPDRAYSGQLNSPNHLSRDGEGRGSRDGEGRGSGSVD